MKRKMACCYDLDRQRFLALDQLLLTVHCRTTRRNHLLWIFRAVRFINQQANTWSEFSMWIYTLNLFILLFILNFCDNYGIEYGKIRNEGRKIMERSLIACRNGDLVGTYNLGTLKYSFVLWSQLGIQMLKLDRWRLLEQTFLMYFLVQ